MGFILAYLVDNYTVFVIIELILAEYLEEGELFEYRIFK